MTNLIQIKIGIDPGVYTGLAIYNRKVKRLDMVATMGIVKSMELVLKWHQLNPSQVHVYMEDARQRKWFGDKKKGGDINGKEQGAGSIKRDCGIWQEFLELHGIPHTIRPPGKGMTKIREDVFKRITGWDKRTSTHSRDAAMLVFET